MNLHRQMFEYDDAAARVLEDIESRFSRILKLAAEMEMAPNAASGMPDPMAGLAESRSSPGLSYNDGY